MADEKLQNAVQKWDMAAMNATGRSLGGHCACHMCHKIRVRLEACFDKHFFSSIQRRLKHQIAPVYKVVCRSADECKTTLDKTPRGP